MATPRVIFCTTVKGRLQHLRKTLPKSLADNAAYDNCAFVVLDYGDSWELTEYLQTFTGALDTGYLQVYRYNTRGPFHMTHAKNMAHRCGLLAGADVLVNLDADNFAGPSAAQQIAEVFERERRVFMWAEMIHRCGKEHQPGIECDLSRGHTGTPPTVRGVSGRIAVSRNAFLEAGGYDERFITWACDDKDFNCRLQMLEYRPIKLDRRLLEAIHHNHKIRFKEYPHAQPKEEFEQAYNEVPYPTSPIVNWGNVGCGTVYKNFGESPINLLPIPTRIFGIGLHKTGTSSLSAALKIIGFDSAHWESGAWARDVWEQTRTAPGRSILLEQTYAASDLPISLMYKQLDQAYPGSKFILTCRDREQWLDSVRRHWTHEHNRFRRDWDVWPISHRLHRELYGCTTFDPVVFSDRYVKHNKEVQEYFSGRPGDLLVMTTGGDMGWQALCKFLNVPVPPVPYPMVRPNI